jgi:hypothetical protein
MVRSRGPVRPGRHGLVGLAEHGAGVSGGGEQLLRGDDLELDRGVWAGTREIGRGVPVLGLELIKLHPGGFLVTFVVDQALDIGNGLDEFRAQLIFLCGTQVAFDHVYADENHV